MGGGNVSHCANHMGLSRGLDGCTGMNVGLAIDHGALSGIPLKTKRGRCTDVLISTTRFDPLLSIGSRGNSCDLGRRTTCVPGPISLLRVDSRAAGRHFLTAPFIRVGPVGRLALGTDFNVSHGCRHHRMCVPGAALCKRGTSNHTSVKRCSESSCLLRLATGCTGHLNSRGLGTLIKCSFREFADGCLGTNGRKFLASTFLFGGLNTNACRGP